jgi:hypothetical protein
MEIYKTLFRSLEFPWIRAPRNVRHSWSSAFHAALPSTVNPVTLTSQATKHPPLATSLSASSSTDQNRGTVLLNIVYPAVYLRTNRLCLQSPNPVH